MSALALQHGDAIVAGDAGTTSFAQYVVYAKGTPIKVVLINTDHYSGNGTRATEKFTLTGVKSQALKALRFTASSSEVTTGPGDASKGPHPTIGGQYFSNADCALLGDLEYERVKVRGEEASVSLAASEALIIYL